MGVMQDTGAPEDTLLGFPVDESERAPGTFTTGQYVGLLANWRYYEIADALDMEIQVLYELNARTNQYEYIGRLKTDGMPTLEEAFVRLKTN
jgi:HK97 family phage major capsid protein